MRLPIGCEDFDRLRDTDSYYVDKTDLIYEMIKGGRYYFLSRPRRFGKSLLVSTLECLFEGKKELFKGLYIEDKWDWSKKYPVVRFTFTDRNRYTDSLDNAISDQLLDYEEEHGLDPAGRSSLQGRFRRLVKHLHKKTDQQVVVLVDEYDAPILDVLTDTDLVKKNRDDLKDFYRVFKNCSKHIRFVFVTGITMFSKDSIFSGLNNLEDISLDPEFSSICGYTDHDLDTVFAEETKKLDREKIKRWYNGYNWLGEEKVYNPFCILLLFKKKDFRDWWFETGTPQYLYECLTQSPNVSVKSIENCWVDHRELTKFNIGSVIPQALFFQSGYLTIDRKEKKEDATKYFLKIPNFEVYKGMYFGLLSYIMGGDNVAINIRNKGEEMLSCIAQHDFSEFKKKLFSFLADVPYRLNQNADLESHYHLILHSMFASFGIVYTSEEPSNLGASDIVLFYDNQVFVIELKMLRSDQKVDTALKNAIQQIKDKRYADPHKDRKEPIHLVGMVFNKEKRNIDGIIHEELDNGTA